MLPHTQSEIEMSVEGITYRLLDKNSAEDVQAVTNLHFDVFYKDEPLSRETRHVDTIHSDQEIKGIKDFLREEATTTVIAVDGKTEDLIGFFVTYACTRTTKEPPTSPEPDSAGAMLDQLYNRLVGPDLLFDQYPDADSILTTQKLAVRKAYRNKGVASRMLDISVQIAGREGCDLITVFSTCDISSRMCEKLGFNLTGTIKWNEIVLECGKAAFKDVKSEGVKGYVKKINEEVNSLLT